MATTRAEKIVAAAAAAIGRLPVYPAFRSR
jgi:hypothetical protein